MFSSLSRSSPDEQRFRYLWRLLCRTWHIEGHCLRQGCGRETLAEWVRKANCSALWFASSELRRALDEAVRRGWAEHHHSPSGHSIFLLKT